jgi:N-acetylglucosaminyldiphosphoundecaprenol N-acetyl-beta-D-mannosaminyltransferase
MTGKSQKYVNILGVNLISTHISQVIRSVSRFISYKTSKTNSEAKFCIFTPNPEIVLRASERPILREILNSADFSVPDGVGLKYASKFLYGKSLNIIPGRVLFERLIQKASESNWKVFLLGGMGKEAELAAKKLVSKYPSLKIASFRGPTLDLNGEAVSKNDKKLQKKAVLRINRFAPDILFVAFGNPKQEFWIYKNLPNLKVRGVMAVGGAFRYVAGYSKLPPLWMEKYGFEWLWRLVAEPKRFWRIFNAIIVFPLKVLWLKIYKVEAAN